MRSALSACWKAGSFLCGNLHLQLWHGHPVDCLLCDWAQALGPFIFQICFLFWWYLMPNSQCWYRCDAPGLEDYCSNSRLGRRLEWSLTRDTSCTFGRWRTRSFLKKWSNVDWHSFSSISARCSALIFTRVAMCVDLSLLETLNSNMLNQLLTYVAFTLSPAETCRTESHE